MKKSLTKEQEDFLRENSFRSKRKDRLKDNHRKEVEERELGRTYSPFLWMTIPILLVALALVSVLFYSYFSAASFLGGPEALHWLSQQEMTPEIRKTLEDAGFGWLPTFFFAMRHKNIIAIGIGIVAVLFCLLFVWMDYRMLERKKRKIELREGLNSEEE